MPKGSFTQSACVLLARPLAIEELLDCVKDFEVARTIDVTSNEWMGGRGCLIAMRPEVNGYVIVDLVNAPWPDSMGDPASDGDLFGAWATGSFGPYVFPGNLARAQAMSFGWSEATAVTSRHSAFVRVKSSYVLGAKPDAPVLPRDYDALKELEFVTSIARGILTSTAALAYFNPNGEKLLSLAGLDEELTWHREHQLPALPAWTKVRLFQLTPIWSLMDTVGMEQLDAPDHEACFPRGAFVPSEVDRFLRNVSEYVRTKGSVIKDGDTIDGPGGRRWRARTVEQSIAPRPREVLRWLPEGITDVPEAAR